MSVVHEKLGQLLAAGDDGCDCDDCFERLDLYVDLELAGAPADVLVPGLRAHLEACPACAEEHESLRALVEADSSPIREVES